MAKPDGLSTRRADGALGPAGVVDVGQFIEEPLGVLSGPAAMLMEKGVEFGADAEDSPSPTLPGRTSSTMTAESAFAG